MNHHGYKNYISNKLFNIILAFLLLVPSSPVMLVIALIIKLQDGKDIFYRGKRLGINKKLFTMYKFRTLIPDAEQLIGNELLSSKHKVVTKFGAILRNTRMDELPQLFNILKGDMYFIGPRPERPIIYKDMCKQIKSYDKRFSVTPGLIGYSQLFTPHSATKEIRASIDNHFIKHNQSLWQDIKLIVFAILKVLDLSYLTLTHAFWRLIVKSWILGKSEDRKLERIQSDKANIFLVSPQGKPDSTIYNLTLKDINDEAFSISSDKEIQWEEGVFKLETVRKLRSWKSTKKKSAYCNGKLYKTMPVQNGKYFYVFKITPTSKLNSYKLHQYFLFKSIG
jgi:lipopolysaccharide/colanic/teichoic acid biosynthesis glycosyltransferase